MCSTISRQEAVMILHLNARDRKLCRAMIAIAVPLILSNILQQFYNTVDAFVLGHYATQEDFAAIGIASSAMNLFLFAIIGSCTGLSVLFAQCYGSRDFRRFRNEHFHALAIGLAATLCLSAAALAILDPLLRILQVPPELHSRVATYLTIVLAGLPASFLYNLYSAILRAVGRTRVILFILCLSVAVNLVLDLYTVRTLGLGITGAALATVVSQCLSACLGFAALRKMYPALLFRKKDCCWNRARGQRTLRFACVTAFHQSGLYLGKLLVQAVINSAGTPVIMAYTATTRIEGFANSFGDSGAAATSVVTAQACGARRHDDVQASFRMSLLLLSLLGLACSAVLYATADYTIGLLVDPSYTEAYTNGVGYLKAVACYYVFCFTGNTFAGWFDGIGRITIPVAGACSHISLRIVLSWLFLPSLGLPAVAHATGIGWIWVNLFWGWIKRASRRKAQT
jgi:putative MATE family efflux protein